MDLDESDPPRSTSLDISLAPAQVSLLTAF
jgi:hypothetical protein